MWQNKYVGIPYKDNGRDETGMDCWGLARHVYTKEFNITLPSFSEDYNGSDRERIAELIAQYQEGWEETTSAPKSGDLVLFRMLGSRSHIGIVTEYPYFLHARDGYLSSIERLDSTIWEKRVVGTFRYKEAAKNNLVAIPNPLKTTRITDYIPEGATLNQVYETLHEQHGLPDEIEEKVVIIVNGRVVPRDEWDYVVKEGDMIEYRAVPGKEVVRMVAVVALVWFTGGLAAGGVAGFAGGTFGAALVSAGIMAAGLALINKIMPIRPPDQSQPTDPGTSKSQNIINGSTNSPMPYSTIPVVLGRIRYTPPLGASNYIEPLETTAYLRMLLLWGYGPLAIEDLRAGSTVLTDYSLDYKTIYGTGMESYAELSVFDNIYGKDVQQLYKNIKLEGTEAVPVASPWQEITFTQPATQLHVAIHFPQGLRKMKVKGDGAGNIYETPFIGEIQYDLVGNNTWSTGLYSYPASVFTLPNSTTLTYAGAYENGSSVYTSNSSNYYQWHTIYTLRGGGVFIKAGCPSENQYVEASAALKQKIAGSLNTINTASMTRIPSMRSDAIALFDVCVYNGQVISMVKRTEFSNNSTISNSGLTVSITAGTVNMPYSNRISLGANLQPFYKQKDAFTYTEKINVPLGVYKIRVRRLNSGAADPANSDFSTAHDAVLYTGAAFANNAPVTDPKVGNFAKTAIRVKATDQLNGTIDGINGLVTSIAPDWDSASGTWIKRPTNNPASLFRLVLQHPSNAQRISDAELYSRVDMPQLQYWHAFCISKGFTFNSVLSSPKSILEVLRDICAAGRGSPAIVDGKWTVVIDEPKTQVIQHFSTHNSWQFEAVKPLVRIPDAFKVIYYNESANYVQDELYVYNIGKDANNSSVFEEIQLPGVTNAQAAYKHARWHLAQLKLRPETYTINTDMEYLVCNRGDLVRVQHDVPSWGVGTARITKYVNSTFLHLDNEIPLQAGQAYTIRIRTATGASITRTLSAIPVNGYYSQISVTQPLSAAEGAIDNLVLVGLLNTESQECLVLSVEPSTTGSARITLVDYTPEMYLIDSSTEYPIPKFNTNITKHPDYFVPTVTQIPTITSVVSDESALEILSKGIFRTRIRISYRETVGDLPLDKAVIGIELQWKYTNDVNDTWPNRAVFPITTDSFYATDVEEGVAYDLRIRYVRLDEITGPWSVVNSHVVVGKSTPPSAVENFTNNISGTDIKLSWNDNPEIDVMYYEVRTSDTNWGLDSNYLFKGGATSCYATPPSPGNVTTWYIKAIDAGNNYSSDSTYTSYTTAQVPNIAGVTKSFNSTNLTSATVDISWANVTPVFGLEYYEVTYDGATKVSKSNSLSIPADWLGNKDLLIRTVDTLGNKSSGFSTLLVKLAPNAPNNTSTNITQGTLSINWAAPTITSIPIWGYEVSTDSTFSSSATIFKGSATTCSVPQDRLDLGSNTFYVRAIDTDNRVSTATTIVYNVVAPGNISNISEFYSSSSLTEATVELRWNSVETAFGLSGYELTYDDIVKQTLSTSIILPANWLGDKVFTVKVVDSLGHKSTGYSKTITKLKPNPVVNTKTQVIDNNVLLYWNYGNKTTLPLAHALLKRGNISDTWETATFIGAKSGEFTSLSELAAGDYVYWIAAVDTDNKESIPVAIPATVAQPPDFKFNAEFISTLEGTKVNATSYAGEIFLPVNTTETWQQHFSTRSWNTIQDQVTAGYPVFIQPGISSGGYYEEIFDYGTVLGSSQVTVTRSEASVIGSSDVSTDISISADGVNYTTYTGFTSIFSINFRYIKVRITVTPITSGSVYKLSDLRVRLDAKQRTEANSVVVPTTGKIVNFDTNFVDIQSIILSANGSIPLNAVYDFRDTVINGTYTLTSNIATINAANHGLLAGQKVRLYFNGGTATSGVYTIQSVINANSYTVNITNANTSGNVSTYPNSMVIYVFTSNTGAPASATTSYQIRGY